MSRGYKYNNGMKLAQARSILKNYRIKPNGNEKWMISFFEDNFPGEFIFNDGSLVICGLIPDFIYKTNPKKLIELFGSVWHNESEVKERKKIFSSLGFDVLILWDYEIGAMTDVELQITICRFVTK